MDGLAQNHTHDGRFQEKVWERLTLRCPRNQKVWVSPTSTAAMHNHQISMKKCSTFVLFPLGLTFFYFLRPQLSDSWHFFRVILLGRCILRTLGRLTSTHIQVFLLLVHHHSHCNSPPLALHSWCTLHYFRLCLLETLLRYFLQRWPGCLFFFHCRNPEQASSKQCPRLQMIVLL